MSRQAELMKPELTIGNSVYAEITKDFKGMFRASQRVLGERHMLTTVCLHAMTFPTDRMSLRMVWDQFQELPVGQRLEILQEYRNRIM